MRKLAMCSVDANYRQSIAWIMSRLTRALNPMPDDVRTALAGRGLTAAYDARPDYQKNDYLGWIARAKRPGTRQKRLDQMLDELARGGVYMNMAWHG
ncbi:YdeI/OmpD-associated family protein [Mesorhizobium sp.]|uniref:YdeI/OmpD-associated family protein n=1 Tax=Mesorhizobium sp. TaxID=1871066 RepID=UPI0025C38284|nr:YdeI/OmpD-associated family protein [Mesorhizobium sp.]